MGLISSVFDEGSGAGEDNFAVVGRTEDLRKILVHFLRRESFLS